MIRDVPKYSKCPCAIHGRVFKCASCNKAIVVMTGMKKCIKAVYAYIDRYKKILLIYIERATNARNFQP